VTDHAKRLPLYLSVAAIITSLAYCSILGNAATIVLSDGALYPKKHYEDKVGRALNSSLFNHSKLTIDVRAFKDKIRTALPEVADVTVSIPLVGRKPVVGLSLVPSQFLFSLPTSKSYIVGSNGVVLAEAHEIDTGKKQQLMLLQEDVPLEIKIGDRVMTPGDISFIMTVTSELAKAKLTVSHLELPVGAGELHVHLKEVPYLIKFAFNGDARQQAGAYLAVKKELGSGQQPLSYVDVRIGERVFVK
jgi:hypothetical protein